MEVMNKQMRRPRSYKIIDAKYNKAMRRAKKNGSSLAEFVEGIVTAYANGFDVKLISPIPAVE